ncbi:MAG: carboxyl transferase domain-containing protein [Dehalococcoidales bacterium]|nr:carboxyl transferase domain-containing protein [Dehalococcoidales bacterium]
MTDGKKFEKVVTWKPGMPWKDAIEELKRRREAALLLGGKEKIERQHSRGKMTVRERIERLVDKGTFFEVGSLMGRGTYDEEGNLLDFANAGFVNGMAEIDGRLVALGGEDFTVSGGSPAGIHKDPSFFIQPVALQYGIPVIQLLDGVGFSTQDYAGMGRMTLPDSSDIWRWPVMALHEVPVISAILGPAAGHVAGQAMLCHFSVMVKGTGQVFPTGSPLVSRSLSYEIDKDELGGTKVHRESGAIDNEAADEDDCLRQVKHYLSYMPNNVWEIPARIDLGDDPNRREEDLLGIVPIERKKPYDMYKLIRLLVDKGEIFEMRRYFGRGMITAFARMDGYAVGILASNPMFNAGAIDGKTAQKTARFIDLCNMFSIPMVLLPDVPGLMIGMDAEKQATVRHGMTGIMAGIEATIPKVQINLRKAYGMGSGVFNSLNGMQSLQLRFGWPSGEWGPIPIEGGVAAAYRRDIESAPDPEKRRRELEENLLKLRSPFRCAESGDVMDIIDPRETRPIICRFIKAAQPFLKRNAGPKRSVRPS